LVVSDIAPDELPIFPALSRAYIANPQRALVGEKKRGGTLGFGFAETVIMVTPYVFFVMGKVVDYLAKYFLDHVAERAVPRLIRRVLGIEESMHEASGPDEQTGSQGLATLDHSLDLDIDAEELKRIVKDCTAQAGMGPELARLVSDAVIGRCLMSRTDTSRGERYGHEPDC
jgi:hypothetical protein